MLSACCLNAQTTPTSTTAANDLIETLVGRLELNRYKATIRGLTKSGDRRQGTDRNRAAIGWIAAQLKSNGCTNTERIKYEYTPPAGGDAVETGPAGEGAAEAAEAAIRAPTSANNDPGLRPDTRLRGRHPGLAGRPTTMDRAARWRWRLRAC